MPLSKIIPSLVILFTLSHSAYAGVGDGAGGGGGRFSLSSGYSPGQFSISAFTPKNGALATVLKYYLLAGAVREVHGGSADYSIKGQESNSAIMENLESAPGDPDYFQLNFQIDYAGLLELRGGATKTAQVTTLRFTGLLANELFAGMEKSGMDPVGWNLDENHKQIGAMYADKWLQCQKRYELASCFLTVGNM